MIVVAIIGVLAAVAIPAYQGYIKKAKINTVVNNFNTATHFIKNELAKSAKETGDSVTDAVGALNDGGKSSPFKKSLTAFAVGTTGCANGVICISETDLSAMAAEDSITIYAPLDVGTINFSMVDVVVIKE